MIINRLPYTYNYHSVYFRFYPLIPDQRKAKPLSLTFVLVYFMNGFLGLAFETIYTSSTGIGSTTAADLLAIPSLGGSTKDKPQIRSFGNQSDK